MELEGEDMLKRSIWTSGSFVNSKVVETALGNDSNVSEAGLMSLGTVSWCP